MESIPITESTAQQLLQELQWLRRVLAGDGDTQVGKPRQPRKQEAVQTMADKIKAAHAAKMLQAAQRVGKAKKIVPDR